MNGSSINGAPRLWGFTPAELHERFWASRGIAVVKRGHSDGVFEAAEAFLLVEPRWFVSFDPGEALRLLYWADASVAIVRLRDEPGDSYYRERLITDAADRFLRVERVYRRKRTRQVRAGLTSSAAVAQLWRKAPTDAEAWRQLRLAIPRQHRPTLALGGRVYDSRSWAEVEAFLQHVQGLWRDPSIAIGNVVNIQPSIWADRSSRPDTAAAIVPPVWIGHGRYLFPDSVVMGPAILWDDPNHPVKGDAKPWDAILASADPHHWRTGHTFRSQLGKRLFDVAFASVALVCSLPLYPGIMLAIWLEDGRPFFFAHRRETIGGREFGCLKFRSMRRDAEQIKARLLGRNQADGPQFFIENDPRLTRVGKLLRLLNLDELPQFYNVLRGDMSIVGPRPSPHRENQYSPGWREARLSVRPGVTGLWQIKRTRNAGTDFQEWIRYDLEYVDRAGFWFDLWIIWGTVAQIFVKLFEALRRSSIGRALKLYPARSAAVDDESDLAVAGPE